MNRHLTFGWRRVTDGAVRLPIVMTFVVAMFAATVALVSFGYVATREWRSGTDLLLERRANEALALVRATLNANMKGAWITAIVPFNAAVLDEDPPYGLFQVAARAFATYPYPESFVLWKRTERHSPGSQGDGVTYAFNRADRPPPWNTTPASDDPFPVVLVRDPTELAGVVAAVPSRPPPPRRFSCSKTRSTAPRTKWSPTRCSRRARRTSCSGSWRSPSTCRGCTPNISIRW